MFSDFIQPSNWPSNSPDLNSVDYSIIQLFNLGCSSAADVSSEDRPSETNPEQMLGHDRPRTNQRCC